MMKSLSLPSTPLVQTLFRPMLFAALGLHALFFFVPFPSEEKKPPENKEAPVKITQLPTTKSAAQSQKTIPKATKPTLPRINRPSTSPTILKTPSPQRVNTATAEAPTPAAARGSTLNRSADNAANPFQDFPHFQNSTPDCFGKGLGENCRIASADLASVASFYQTEPAKKGFTVQSAEETTGTKIFQVSKGGKTLYLSLFTDDSTTVVLLSEQKIADLTTLKGSVTVPEDHYVVLSTAFQENDRGATATDATPEQFEQPSFFFSKIVGADAALQGLQSELRQGIDGSPRIDLTQSPAEFYKNNLEASLQEIYTEGVSKVGQYGGGDLYQLKKGSTTVYLSTVPVKGSSGTIVVTWVKDPRK